MRDVKQTYAPIDHFTRIHGEWTQQPDYPISENCGRKSGEDGSCCINICVVIKLQARNKDAVSQRINRNIHAVQQN